MSPDYAGISHDMLELCRFKLSSFYGVLTSSSFCVWQLLW